MNTALTLEPPAPRYEFNPRVSCRAEMRVKTRQICARTGRVVKESPWQKNLINDGGLNILAGTSPVAQPPTFFAWCKVGSGTNPNKIASGAITFTQATNQLTASGGFFTAAMVGGLFKWGTGSGGVEVYITAFTSATVVTVATSTTQAVPTVGTVWMVQETALQTYLYRTSTLQTTAGSNGTTLAAGVLTMQKTFNFATQAAPYTVNEIGYQQNNSATADGACVGRIVLTSSDVVPTTNFYQVVLALALTYTPTAPAAVANVGTNIDTAGTFAVEWLPLWVDNPAGGSQSHWLSGQTPAATGTNGTLRAFTVTYTQNAAATNASVLAPTSISFGNIPAGVRTAVLGQFEWTVTVSTPTSGQTMYGFGFCGDAINQKNVFDIKLTTPFVLPTGTFQATVKFQMTYGRTLTN